MQPGAGCHRCWRRRNGCATATGGGGHGAAAWCLHGWSRPHLYLSYGLQPAIGFVSAVGATSSSSSRRAANHAPAPLAHCLHLHSPLARPSSSPVSAPARLLAAPCSAPARARGCSVARPGRCDRAVRCLVGMGTGVFHMGNVPPFRAVLCCAVSCWCLIGISHGNVQPSMGRAGLRQGWDWILPYSD